MHRERAVQRRFVIRAVRHTGHPFSRHLNQVRTDADSFYFVTQTREVFAKPTGAAANVEYSTAGRQRQGDGDVREIAEVTMRVLVHAFVLVSLGLIGEVVERLRPQMVLPLFRDVAQVISRSLLVINVLEFRRASIRSRWKGIAILL